MGRARMRRQLGVPRTRMGAVGSNGCMRWGRVGGGGLGRRARGRIGCPPSLCSSWRIHECNPSLDARDPTCVSPSPWFGFFCERSSGSDRDKGRKVWGEGGAAGSRRRSSDGNRRRGRRTCRDRTRRPHPPVPPGLRPASAQRAPTASTPPQKTAPWKSASVCRRSWNAPTTNLKGIFLEYSSQSRQRDLILEKI